MTHTILLLVEPTSFSAQLKALLTELGYTPLLGNNQTTITQVMIHAPVLALVDLAVTTFEWERLVRYIRGPLKKNNHIPVVGIETDLPAALAERAYSAGCTALISRTEALTQLKTIIETHRWHPDPVLCNRPLPQLAQRGIAEFNQGLYFDCHETLEDVWNAHDGLIRVFYQGILQIAVGYLHIRRQNWRGAVKVLERGIPKAAHFRPICQGVDVADLVMQAQMIRQELIHLGPDRIAEFETRPLPLVKMVGTSPDG